jgi:bifunctional non-homologous end joining protein LigD
MLHRLRSHPSDGFVKPCLPTPAERPPSGPGWLHEIKHDGFRIIACKEGKRVGLYSRPGNDLTPSILSLRSPPCVIDGRLACDANGLVNDRRSW